MARGSRARLLLWAVLLQSGRAAGGQSAPDRLNGFSLHPPYLNIAQGADISATATCGEDGTGRPRVDLYCKLVGGPAAGASSQTIQGQFCDHCLSDDAYKAHAISNAIDGTERWWQSPPLSRGLHYNQVNVTLNFGQLFHVAYILIKFANSPRPDLWVLERSVDFGRSYRPWQYFAHSKRDCEDLFGTRAHGRITRDDDVICTTEYSRILPLENGEIVVSLVNGRPGSTVFNDSPVLREFTKATNIRLRFLRTNTLLGHLISKTQKDPTVTRRYYYSIKDISIGGRCVCNGHADTCNAQNPENPFLLQCECQHNTCGISCERCCPGFNQKPWQPATTSSANECESCNCHGHAKDCYYDAAVSQRRASMNIHGQYEGGGVCLNCQHHTAGMNCERCAPFYYRRAGVPKDAPDGCVACRCNPEFAEGCDETTGVCQCRPRFSGQDCNRCAPGHYNFPQCTRSPFYTTPHPVTMVPTPGSHQSCKCNVQGTVGNTCFVNPYTQRCECKPNYTGPYCSHCAAGYFGKHCQQCQCYSTGVSPQVCDPNTGQCLCRRGVEGYFCERCSAGHFRFPSCEPCLCSRVGTLPQVCDGVGRCLCRPEFGGSQCDHCRVGHHSFPNCQACSCDPVGSVNNDCDAAGRCRCHPNYTGPTCRECAYGYYGYPTCSPCQCSPEGSYDSACDQTSGQCRCQPHFAGQHCDTCASSTNVFPRCQVTDCRWPGTASRVPSAHSASCQCLPNLEGTECEKCKPLYWKPVEGGPDGCVECGCVVSGAVSGIAECHQGDGSCYCKPNVCGELCDWCVEGHYKLQDKNYFGCQGCGCDIGGSANLTCSMSTGTCQCRANIEGRACNMPRSQHYFPDLHHLKYEIEDGSTPNGRAVRFGFDSKEFVNFSWRGYAQLSTVQPAVVMSVTVTSPNLFRIVFRYKNRAPKPVRGRISVTEEVNVDSCCNLSPQTKDIIFARSKEPSFVTVSRSNYGDPFVFTPGTWTVSIEAEGVLLDYLVLLPSEYYEAPILQFQVTDPCLYTTEPQQRGQNCLLYKYLPLDSFPTAGVSDGVYMVDGKHQPTGQLLTSAQATMADLTGTQVQVRFRIRAPQPGQYVLVLEYAHQRDGLHQLDVSLHSPLQTATHGKFNLYSCKYSFLCRSVAIDHQNRIAIFDSSSDAELRLQGTSVSFLLHQVYLIPVNEFCIEYVEPKVHCVAVHGPITNRSSCVASKYEIPVSTVRVEEGDLSTASDPFQPHTSNDPQVLSQHPPTMVEPGDIILLKSPQNQVTFNTRVPNAGRYVVLVHFYQPLYPMFPVKVTVDGADPYAGSFRAFFCPHGFGCRTQVISGKRIELDLRGLEVSLTLTVPKEKALWVEYILIIPSESYNPDLQKEKPLDKSFDFITACGGNSFHIDPATSSRFCVDSAKSLVAFYNNGALPCMCNSEGSTGPECSPFGGQCSCRPHVIGRQCDRCATGHYMFPNCRPCSCGRRLCDELTGRCICPPQTVKPKCEACEKQTFSYHPLAGCEHCNCSREGIVKPASPDCHRKTGQCRCKPQVTGRQCDRCSVGFSRYPECIPCDCNREATQPNVCDPVTGRCLCKENVAGARCDTCRPGSFHLDPANPKGCTSCFCFGVTDQCRSSDKPRTKHMEMREWNLFTANKQKVPVVYNRRSNTVVADVQELPDVIRDLHWAAPESYLGDKVRSYRGFLSYQIKSFGLPSEGMTLLDKRSDVQLRGEQMTVVYFDPKSPAPDRVYHGRVQLLEDNFRHAVINTPVSRENFMLLLSNVEDLQIRALYFSQTQRLSLGSVQLEEASVAGTGNPATNVEVCSCPPNYLGDSCQRCGVGYYRERKGFFLGRCVPCRCHGHSNQCEDQTGKCIGCQHNTEGDHCERCQAGFYGNAVQSVCNPCACPHRQTSNNFATQCDEINGAMRCLCKPGYTGTRCERCAPGYFGNPLEIGSQCRKCQCSNPDSSCDPLTGQCNNCEDCTNEEPKDTSSDEKCDTCDSCVETLLLDLNKMDSDIQKIKLQLQNANISASAQLRMNDLDRAIKRTEAELNEYRATVNNQVKRTDNLEDDNMNLIQDINALKEKAEKNSRSTQLLLTSIDETTRRAREILTNIEKVVSDILDLIKKLNTIGSGTTGREMAEVERMLNEMRNLNFDQERRVADREKKESERLLDHIKNTLLKNINENKLLATDIKDALSTYLSKLMDLQAAMNEAANLTRKADDINKINSITLEAIKERHDELEDKKLETSNLIQMADETLGKLKNMLRMLEASQEEYEKQGAELDGALPLLNERSKQLTEASSKEPIVSRAEDHANNLDQLSKQLQRAIEEVNQDSLLQQVINASDAYENIINAVNEAATAARRAEEAADDALQMVVGQDLPGQAADVNSKSARVLSSTTDAEKTLNRDVIPKLQDVKERLKDGTEKKNQLKTDLAILQRKMKQINRDDVGQTLDQAQGHRQRMKNLTDSLPGLVQKLKDLSQIQPVNNISKNINRIRELIDQAQGGCKTWAMKFTGESGVEVRLPTNLDHLKAYTSLLLYLKRPEISRGDNRRRKRQESQNMFVLYLGHKNISKDYMGMVLEDGKLVTIYKLGSEESRISNERVVSTKTFDHIKFERIMQYGSLNYSLVSLSGGSSSIARPTSQRTMEMTCCLTLIQRMLSSTLEDFPTFTPPSKLNYRKYEGCIELGVLNEKLISLYNFEETFNINTTKDRPCERYKPTKEPGSDGYYFDGTGYALINLTGSVARLSIEQTIQASTKDAVLLYLEKLNTTYALTIEDGRLVFRYNVTSNINKPIISTKELDLTKDNVIKLQMVRRRDIKKVVVRVGHENVIDADVDLTELNFPNYYLGGIPMHIKESLNMPVKSSLRACVKNPKATYNKDLSREYTVGVSKGCSQDLLLVRTAHFTGNGLLGLNATRISFPANFHIGFGFSTSQLDALLFSYGKDNLEVSLENGKVKVNILGKTLTSKRSFNDGADHYVSVQRRRDRAYLNVDDLDRSETTLGLVQPTPQDAVYVGGNKGMQNFDGCINNVFLKRENQDPKVENLVFSTEESNVNLDTCRQQRAPEMLMLKEGRKSNGQETVKVGKNGKNHKLVPDHSIKENTGQEFNGCPVSWQPKAISGAYQFGNSPDSRLEYDHIPKTFKERSKFSIDVRTVTREGVIFYVADRSEKSYMTLYVSRGRFFFVFAVDRKRLKIRSRSKHNDGQWHTVVFSRENNKGKLVIDGLRTQQGTLTGGPLLKVESPFYLGGLPSEKGRRSHKLPRQSFHGCIKNFKLDGNQLHPPSRTFGVTPCFDGNFEQGAYFAAEGAYLVLDNSFVVGKDFELLFEARPRTQTGVLFHVNSPQGNYLSLYMYKGKVTVHVNNGAGDFNTSVTPPSLCDGQWHRIAVIKRNNVVQLDVDAERDHVVGPSASLSTDTADPLYVGGLPDGVQVPHILSRTSFIGCMANVMVNVKPVSLRKATEVHGAVSVTQCPAM
ncbi:LOW QUALITY PROTEIN: laminin subunit alpha-3-like [Pristis pectinata]|uniref:LOW QUALITY PROTEIN: laminin subunit alpha-3-like n=1 Tax=Pristis pectinata TaxID=685728 RepID=UPI00223D6AFF|nr:LOW QUALITY PROTEIN: laminin subunit alpha-3-like [Pristis pectinata]